MEFHPLHGIKLKLLEVPSNKGKASQNLKAARILVYKSSTVNNEEQLLVSFHSGNAHRNFGKSNFVLFSFKLWNL